MGKLWFQYNICILMYWALVLMYTTAEREYFILQKNLSWNDARTHCQICFKELVTLTPDNIHLITQRLNSDHWIGLRKNFNSTNNSSVPWSRWANGDPLFFQNWYPGWPVFKSPPPKIDCCSCSCTCTANKTTENSTSVTDNDTDISSLFDSYDQNMTNYTSLLTSYSNPSYTTSTSPFEFEAACERSPMPVVPETNENGSYIEDSCVAMLSFGPWVEKSCLELLPFICYEDRFFGQVNVTDVTSENATLSWLPAPGDITHYSVLVSGEEERETNLSALTYDLVELIPGGLYQVQVFPVKCERNLNPQNATFYTKPNQVTDLKVVNVTEKSVALSWNKPEGTLNFYLVKTEGKEIEQKAGVDGNQTVVVNDLIPGSLYTFTVLAAVQDKSRLSEESDVTTNTKPGKVHNLTVSDNTNSSVQLTWTAPEGNFTGFRVKAVVINTNEEILNIEVNQEERGKLVDGLPSGSKIHVSVTTLANYPTIPNYTALALEGDEETTVTYTAPGPISNLDVSTSESTLTARWSGPQGNYSSFKVNLKLDGNNVCNETPSDPYVRFVGLKNAAKYTVTVFAVSGHFEGPPVTFSIFTKPSRPTDAKVASENFTSITFEWKAPENIATPLYRVKLNSTFWNYNISEKTSSTKHTFVNLTSGTKYDFEVSALAGEHESLPEPCSGKTVSKKVEIGLSMLCTSEQPLLCSNSSSRDKVLTMLEEYFYNRLGNNIFWEPPK